MKWGGKASEGKLMFKQYIPTKRSRFGIKLFVLCDCETNYILDFIVYTGETRDIDEQGYELGKSGDIVGTLIKPYLEKGHMLFVDNWYSSPALFLWLHNKTTNACGTVRKNRKHMPKMEEKLKKGNIQFMCSDILLALRWCDRREVWVLSTCHDSRILESSKVDYKMGKKNIKPNCVLDYNKRMGAVDKKYMILSSIESGLKEEVVAESQEDVPLRLSGRHFPKLVTSDACKSGLPRKACVFMIYNELYNTVQKQLKLLKFRHAGATHFLKED
ncbi:hypothetical protein J437_LFUL003491 [Ladona fulva]|uniref:PiggyBac transposable element-derived protein domain-containing protein n=1 Tax=Ladona fulva TaxID=123851 RepID=A0A8K0NVT4_LADFU|nr:hypothetical protein J437_LFUL003491 [Ladona fulva]